MSRPYIELLNLLFSFDIYSLQCFIFDVVPWFLVWFLLHVNATDTIKRRFWWWILPRPVAFLGLVVRWWGHEACAYLHRTILNWRFWLYLLISGIYGNSLDSLWILIILGEPFGSLLALIVWPSSLSRFWTLIGFQHILNY